ncbi:expressed unknown protein [Seminavis robusta]|uniref:Uncharacterized protein n=1 Tax=Seminavis robusta TaxID=568900 RepID=A0A9N8DM95_9STRA|nr:expressed unknown protein [Seminavis robusta]|eukprot:Sro239_g095820.1 n/a (448) ;mRNA; f:25409-26752
MTTAPPSYETKRKTKVVYGRVVFQQRTGDLTLGKSGLSFTSTDDQDDDGISRPPLVHRVRWNSIHKHFANKTKPLIKIKTVEKLGQAQDLLFKLSNRDELEAFKEDLVKRLAPPIERHSLIVAMAAPVEEEEESESPYMETYVMTKSVDRSSKEPELAVVPFPPTVEIEEEEDVDDEKKPMLSTNAPVVPVPETALIVKRQQQRPPKNMATDMTICTTTTAGYDDTVNMNGGIYGTSRYLSPAAGPQLIAEAEFEEFAPCSCVCYKFCVNDKLRKRTYVRVYENRVESNIPFNPWCCLSDERCIVDAPRILFFDKAPNRVGMYCSLIPCVCCGPPVIYNKVPKACCGLVDMRPCYGEQIVHSQCDCFQLRSCLCCGPFCYQCFACPLFFVPIKNGENFLANWKGALNEFQDRHDIDETQRATFVHVEDKCCNTDSGRPIQAIQMERC